MPFPDPVPGLVIRYSYLWAEEYGRGREEGVKDRPCAIILVSTEGEGERVVTVLPVTHAPPSDPNLAVELPPATKRRLRLDDARSWVALSEANASFGRGPICARCGAATPRALPAGCCPMRCLRRFGGNSSPPFVRAAPGSCREASSKKPGLCCKPCRDPAG